MINFSTNTALPRRIVLLGATGFIARSVLRRLQKAGLTVLPLSRRNLDLTADHAGDLLSGMLSPNDVLVFIAANVPVKTDQMLLENVKMAVAVCKAISVVPTAQVVYVSSDAVYADSKEPITELSAAAPGSLHGVMHLTRELMLRHAAGDVPLCILRPTLVFGNDDPHNGYGPNRFLRQAAARQAITLFGNGEERRDHVWVEDVAEIISRCVENRCAGLLNVATGQVVSFRDIAENVESVFDTGTRLITVPRRGAMPHNGYRAFDIGSMRKSFPNFSFRSLNDYINDYKKATQSTSV
ncbi:MAG: NAD(P)-dependent oxidoreductase [Gammaproteobacteria bacterium]|nr:NAD(P)-dependent oxidoreductase [Gammaproteobacteria bacterium]